MIEDVGPMPRTHQAATWHGLAENGAYPVGERLMYALRALAIYADEYDRLEKRTGQAVTRPAPALTADLMRAIRTGQLSPLSVAVPVVRTHKCPGCRAVDVKRSRLACLGCWGRLPLELENMVVGTYLVREINPSMHRKALRAALKWYREHPIDA